MAKKNVKVKFLISPTGGYKLAYSAGQTAELPEGLATELIENKVAVKVTAAKQSKK